ncbi:hypothetical protein DASC09_018740 [Saccharomycopsis crataegensis]|uniref:Uncharacterized protein n=1 Tax=Saccharomycopsis crataegensis TaxID=43959 RepID=A0AAV5QIU4_9ASCO|nr:hypothetical protein DASC09_018740 [Saccharomycopsis crataegensis]
MKFASVILMALVPSMVSADVNKRHIHKREAKPNVQTVYETDYNIQTVNEVVTVYDDGEATSTPAATTTVVPTLAAVKEAVVEGTTSSSLAATSSASSAAASSAATSSVASSSAASSSASSSSSSSSAASSGIGSAGALGITYSPYSDSGSCKSAAEVKTDISKLSGYDIIRLYAVDCSGVENVLSAMSSDQKLFAGLYTLSTIEADVSSMWTQIQAAGKDWSVVDTVSVGNELVNSGEATPAQIEAAISTAKSALSSKGYTGQIVSVDTLVAVTANPDLCKYSDYVAVNCHPFFDGGVAAADAGTWLLKQIEDVYTTCGSSKNVLITETGWPHSGDANGDAVPSVANQEAALTSIKKEAGASVFLFTVYNDKWKSPGAYNVEQSWGIYGDSPA